MMKYFILDADYKPVEVSRERWMDWMINEEREGGRRVRLTHFPDGTEVSTVILPWICTYYKETPFIAFETMIFGPLSHDNELGEIQEVYGTYDEALAGHERIVTMVQEYLDGVGT